MKLEKNLAALIAVSILVATLSACQKPEGSAEHVGKEIDEAANTAGQKIETAGEDVQDAAKGRK